MEAAVVQELESFEVALQNAPMGIKFVSADRRVLWANDRVQKLMGYSAAEYVGKHLSETHQDPLVLDEIMERLSAGEELQDYPIRLKTKSGEVIFFYLNANSYFREGKFIHTRCFLLLRVE